MLNIAEQIFATRFQTLPVPTLEEYLPEGKIIRVPYRRLNVAKPMDQGCKEKSAISLSLLSKSTDPITLEYLRLSTSESLACSRHTQTEQQLVGQMGTKRFTSKKKHLFREANPVINDNDEVVIYCRACRSEASTHVDPSPVYEVSTGRYMTWKGPCSFCKPTATGRSEGTRFIGYMIPVNPKVLHSSRGYQLNISFTETALVQLFIIQLHSPAAA